MASKFVYVTYIRATPARVWEALTKPEFTRQYFFGARHESAWTIGAPWKLIGPEGKLTDAGEVLEVDPPRHLALKWRNEFVPEMTAEGFTRCAFDLVPQDDVTQLTVTHEIERDQSKTIAGVSMGWPKILAGLKTLLETGAPLLPASKAASPRQGEPAQVRP